MFLFYLALLVIQPSNKDLRGFVSTVYASPEDLADCPTEREHPVWKAACKWVCLGSPGNYYGREYRGKCSCEANFEADKGFQSPSLTNECASCLSRVKNGTANYLRGAIDGGKYNECNDKTMMNYWCNGGVGVEARNECNTIKNGECSNSCGGTGGGSGRTDTGGPATACNGNVASQGNESRYASWNGQCTGAVQTSQSGGIGQGCCEVGCGADAQCDEQTAGQGNCNASCKVTTNQTTTTIGGTVRDEQGRGVRGVKVWVNDPTSSIGYRGGMFKVTTTKDDGTYSVDVSRANYFVRIPGESAAGLSGRTDGEDNLKIFQAGSVSQSYESQPAGAGCADKCDFTVTLLHSSPDPTAPPTDPPVVYPTKVRIANSEVGLVVSQRILDFSGQYTPSNPLAVDWILEDLSGQPQKVYIQFGFGTGTNVQWDSRVYSSDNITYTFESGSCECGATNLCASSCQFTKLASGITYTNPIRCSYNDTDPSITFPTAANKNSWCNRNKRTLGDANGDNIINAVDYTYYLRGVLNGKIPPGVNPDFNGNGDIDRNDLMIWTQGEGQ